MYYFEPFKLLNMISFIIFTLIGVVIFGVAVITNEVRAKSRFGIKILNVLNVLCLMLKPQRGIVLKTQFTCKSIDSNSYKVIRKYHSRNLQQK